MTIASSLRSGVQQITSLANMGFVDAEEQKFQDEVNAVKRWWNDSRWRFTKRYVGIDLIIQAYQQADAVRAD